MSIVTVLWSLVAMGVLIVGSALMLWFAAWAEEHLDDDDPTKGGGKPA